ncbi:hypothetical protein M1437_04220 [Patescibacteria group bacterium]|nr:hypothetical protein [Patescibacteria group bacterium]
MSTAVQERLKSYSTEELIGLRNQAVKQSNRLKLARSIAVLGLDAVQLCFDKVYSRKVTLPILQRETPEEIEGRHSAVCMLGRRIDMMIEAREKLAKRYEGIIR